MMSSLTEEEEDEEEEESEEKRKKELRGKEQVEELIANERKLSNNSSCKYFPLKAC